MENKETENTGRGYWTGTCDSLPYLTEETRVKEREWETDERGGGEGVKERDGGVGA